jgi:outer membrane protein assembly factor BamB
VALLADQRVVGVNLQADEPRWSYPTRNLVPAAPIPYAGAFLVLAQGGQLLLLDQKDGSLRASVDLDAQLSTGGTEFGNSLFVADAAGNACRVDLERRVVRWKRPATLGQALAPAVGDDLVVFVSERGEVVALDIRDGSKKWEFKVSEDSFVRPGVMVRNQFIAGNAAGLCLCFDIHSGKLYWTFTADSAVRADPGIGPGVLFIGSEKGTLYKFSLY